MNVCVVNLCQVPLGEEGNGDEEAEADGSAVDGENEEVHAARERDPRDDLIAGRTHLDEQQGGMEQ